VKFNALIILILTVNFSFGQQAAFEEIELPEEMVINKITQDSRGFLWLCSSKGVVKYNGFEFETIGLQNKKITSINTSEPDMIWIGTSEGEIYTIIYSQREAVPKLMAKFNAPIKDIVTYSKGVAIAIYGEGLFKYQNNKFTAIKTISSKEIYDLEVLSDTKIAVASDRGIDIIDTENYSVFENLKGLPDNIIVSLCRDRNELVAATYDSKLFTLNLKTRSITIIDENPKREKYIGLQSNGGKILVHTNKEIAEWQNGRKTVFSKKQNDWKISAFFVDDENNLWLAQGKNSVFKSNLFFLHFTIDIKEDIQAMTFYKNFYYLGTTNGIQVKSEISLASIKILLPKENITVIKPFNGRLWIGTFSNGLYVYNIEENKFFHFGKVENIDDNTILDIEMSDDDQIEIATLAGIKSIDSNFYRNKKFKTIIPNIYSYDIFFDSKGVKWYGKDRNGITKIENKDTVQIKSIENSTDHKYYKLGSIYSIAEHNRAVYFASTSLGLVQYKNNLWTIIQTTHKPNDPITSIIKQNENTLLLLRLSRFDIIDLSDLHILPCLNDNTADENDLYLNNYCLVQGDVYFAYDKGITRFSNNSFLKKDPQITLDKVEVNLEKVKKGINQFNQEENNLRFTFIGSWLTNPKLVEYQYKLEGFDNEWRKTKDRVVSYPKLPTGKYIFKLRASENGAFKNEKTVEYAFDIIKSFYNTWWFYTFLISIISAFLYWFQLRKKKEELLRAELAKKIIEAELINLKSQLDPHFLFNTFNTLIGLVEEDPNKGVRFIEILTSFFRSLAELSNKELVTVEEELTLVKNYRDILKERFGSNLQITIENSLENIRHTLIPPMSLQMLIENAVKHNEASKAKQLLVSIGCNEKYILVKNIKNSKILNGTESLGIGNKNIFERYRLLGQALPFIENGLESYTFYLPIVRSKKNI
jgi:hypothetical protein